MRTEQGEESSEGGSNPVGRTGQHTLDDQRCLHRYLDFPYQDKERKIREEGTLGKLERQIM